MPPQAAVRGVCQDIRHQGADGEEEVVQQDLICHRLLKKLRFSPKYNGIARFKMLSWAGDHENLKNLVSRMIFSFAHPSDFRLIQWINGLLLHCVSLYIL